MSTDVDEAICAGCGGAKKTDQYICPDCWDNDLPPVLQSAIYLTPMGDAFRHAVAWIKQRRYDRGEGIR